MDKLHVKPVSGLRAYTDDQDQVDSEWKDFFSDGEESAREKATMKVDNEGAYEDDYEEEDDDKDKSGENTARDFSLDTLSHQDHEDKPSTSEQGSHSQKKHRKRPKSGKRKKGGHEDRASKPPPLNLHPDIPPRRQHQRQSRSRGNQDAMSDQEVMLRHHRGRRLQRRSQMKKYHSIEHDVEQAGRDVLEQKFIELEDLLTRPLTDTRGVSVKTGTQRVHGMVQMHHAHNRMGHGTSPASAGGSSRHRRVGAWVEGAVLEEEETGTSVRPTSASSGPKSVLCAFYKAGRCSKGHDCKFSHNLDLDTEQTSSQRAGEGEDGEAYSTIRVLQMGGGGKSVQLHISYDKQRPSADSESSHHSRGHGSKVTSKPPKPRRHRKGSVESSPTSSSGASDLKKRESVAGNERSYRYDSEEEEREKSDGGGQSPRRVYLPTDMHLKNSDNPKLKEWLKRKNTEYRRARKAERQKKKDERNNAMIENELKIARREKSSERVKEWMDVKRKEAAKRHKEEKKRQKEEKARMEARQRSRSPGEGSMKVTGVERPQSAPARPKPKNYIPIQRPDSAVTAAAKLDHGDGTAPKTPETKFVYKRPVSGRVRLMKLQNVRNADVKKAEQKRADELTAEEKEKKARTSYDAWLITKRKEDVEKRREAQRQKEMAKSDPDMECIVPELARKRINRIKNGKKRIDTGMRSIDSQENSRFGGADFGEGGEEKNENGETQHEGEGDGGKKEDEGSVPKPSSYQLSIEGSAASIVELNMRAKPAIAKTHAPIPQSKLSPRRVKPSVNKVRPESAKSTDQPFSAKSRDRPTSAKSTDRPYSAKSTDRPYSAKSTDRPYSAKSSGRPGSSRSSGRVQAVMETDYSGEPNPFKLPFPDELGVPEQVRHIQEKIFAKSVIESQNSERPEPQGCAATAEASCPKGIDGHHHDGVSARSDTNPRTSMQLLQEIEACAEKEAALNGIKSALMKVVKDSMEEVDAEEVGKEVDDDGGEKRENDDEEKERDEKEEAMRQIREKLQALADDGRKTACEDEGSAGEDKHDENVHTETVANDGVEANVNSEEQRENENDDNKSKRGDTDKYEDSFANVEGEEERGNGAPMSVSPDEASPEPAYQYEEEADNHQDNETNNDASTQNTNNVQDTSEEGEEKEKQAGEAEKVKREGEEGGDDEMRKSLSSKHVSFSEDLTTTTVFDSPASLSSSSNFSDERGGDEKEESYPSLDDVPDPE